MACMRLAKGHSFGHGRVGVKSGFVGALGIRHLAD